VGAATSGIYDQVDIDAAAPSDASFVALYRTHASFTWSCLRRLGVPTASIDDAMQEVWVTAHRRLATLHSPAAAKSWLYGIARRVVSHQRRTEGRHRRKLDAFGDTATTLDEADRESALIVESMLASLDARVREAFVLSELEGWTAPEISRATGANTNTIYWRVRTAKDQLRRSLGDRDLGAEVIQLRDATKPSRKSLSHCWMIIVPKLGKAPLLGSIFAGWSAAKLAIVGAGLTVAIATGVEIGMRPAASSEVAAQLETPAKVAKLETPAPADAPAIAAAVLPTAPVEVAATVEVAPIQRPSPVAAPARVAPAPAAPAVDVTADDTKLLADAKLALTEGRVDDARTLLASHRDRFPTSKLASVRDRLEVACAAK
jgi:RNA polymerase sigma-70 factor (ECF subfamily)